LVVFYSAGGGEDMVTREDLVTKPRGFSAARRYLHWHAAPAMINGLGAIEGELERLAVAVRRSPARTLGAAVTLGVLLSFVRPRQRGR